MLFNAQEKLKQAIVWTIQILCNITALDNIHVVKTAIMALPCCTEVKYTAQKVNSVTRKVI